MRILVAALVVVALEFTPAPAVAADALSPVDGETVGSRPTFVFDVLNGVAEIELSRAPETMTAGPEAGQFVDRAASDYAILYNRQPRDGVAPWDGARLESGRYYWHVRLRDDGSDSVYDDEVQHPWGTIRTLVVEDEPVVFEGWLVRVQRLRSTRGCATRLRLYGTIAWSDNEELLSASARYSVSLKTGSRVVGRVRGKFNWLGHRFDGTICSKRRITARSLTATATLRDGGDHLVTGERRRLQNPGS
jgi:hypothetical protein